MNFLELLITAKEGSDFAIVMIIEQYRPLLVKESMMDGVFDEDLYQELCLTLLNCIRKFKI